MQKHVRVLGLLLHKRPGWGGGGSQYGPIVRFSRFSLLKHMVLFTGNSHIILMQKLMTFNEDNKVKFLF